MAGLIGPQTFDEWMRVMERRMGMQERRGQWTEDDILAMTDGSGGGGGGLPPGGTDGQVLTKVSAIDSDADWENLPPSGALATGGSITGAITAAPNTYYPINLPANAGNVAITMPTAPAQGSVVAFVRIDSNIFTSTPRITAPAGATIGDASPYVISVRNVFIRFTYEGSTWWPTVPVGGASGLLGATPSSAFNPSLMSRDVNGRTQVEDPVLGKDAVNLEYLQAHAGGGGTGTDEVAIRPDDPTVPEPTTELWVDTDDSTSGGFGKPTVINDWNGAVPDGYYTGPSNTPNGPTTSAFAGFTISDGVPYHYTQIVYRIVSTSTSIEQYQRQMVGIGVWTPWTCIALSPTDWVNTGYTNVGATVATFNIRRRNNQVDLYATGNITNAFASSTTGDYGNFIVFKVPAAYIPTGFAGLFTQGLQAGSGGPALNFYIDAVGAVGIPSGPPYSFPAGQAFSVTGTYSLS